MIHSMNRYWYFFFDFKYLCHQGFASYLSNKMHVLMIVCREGNDKLDKLFFKYFIGFLEIKSKLKVL